MTHKDLKPRGIKPPLHLLPIGPLQAIATCYPNGTLEELPFRALCAAVSALHDGATKYQPWNWLERTPDDREVYASAALRHVVAYNDDNEDDYASDSQVHHLAHAFATVVILMEKLGTSYSRPEVNAPLPGGSILFNLLMFTPSDNGRCEPSLRRQPPGDRRVSDSLRTRRRRHRATTSRPRSRQPRLRPCQPRKSASPANRRLSSCPWPKLWMRSWTGTTNRSRRSPNRRGSPTADQLASR